MEKVKLAIQFTEYAQKKPELCRKIIDNIGVGAEICDLHVIR